MSGADVEMDAILKQKLEAMAAHIVKTQERMSDHLIALLEPSRLQALWRLKGSLDKVHALIQHTLRQPVLSVSESMLDLVQNTDAILLDMNSRLDAFEAEDEKD